LIGLHKVNLIVQNIIVSKYYVSGHYIGLKWLMRFK
jgi:hypothetical protein